MLGKVTAQVRYRRALRTLEAPAPDPTYFSRFGGLWTDRRDAPERIESRLQDETLSARQAEQLRHWVTHGYVMLDQAVEQRLCDAVRADLDQALDQGDERLLMTSPVHEGYHPLKAGMDTERARIVDVYVHLESVRRALFSAPIADFLRLVFEAPPLLFQSLTFEKGSQQQMHQDSGFVVVSSPLKFAAAWIALEDVKAGSGELTYFDGSHRLPEYLFSGKYKHWNAKRDGDEQHAEWHRLLYENAEKMGMEAKSFLPRKGDVLIWSADLAHAGSEVTDPALTRKSLVGHYCPDGVDPFYFKLDPRHRHKLSADGGFYASQHYQLDS